MKIYVAGKITKPNWRRFLGAEIDSSELDAFASSSTWPEREITIGGHRHIYTGPFQVRCDHGCFHDAGHAWDEDGFCGNVTSKELTVHRCVEAIKSADLVYAWIDDLTCYATLTEIGFAKGLGKTVVVASPKEYKDLWWIFRLVDRISIRQNPQEGLVSAIAWKQAVVDILSS